MPAIDANIIIIIVVTFLIAGLVKGVIGLGLPIISLAILVARFDLTTAMALLIVPSLVTNIWQAVVGGNLAYLFQRLWPFLLAASLTIWIGVLALSVIHMKLLTILLGALLIAYALISLSGFHPRINPASEHWAGSICGIINGLFTGMTGSFVFPGVMYLQALDLDRHQLVQAMGILFCISTLMLGFALQTNNLLDIQSGSLSILAVIPALTGMWVGRAIRQRLSEQRFRVVFYWAISLLGIYIVIKSLPA